LEKSPVRKGKISLSNGEFPVLTALTPFRRMQDNGGIIGAGDAPVLTELLGGIVAGGGPVIFEPRRNFEGKEVVTDLKQARRRRRTGSLTDL
jgi:hypothetical protein